MYLPWTISFVSALLLMSAALGCAEDMSSKVQVMGVWEASLPEWEQKVFGSDHAKDLLLYIRGQTLPSEGGHELKITEVDLHIHFESGATSITRCGSTRDALTFNSISCKRELVPGQSVQLSLESRNAEPWSGLISWWNTPIPVTFARLKLVSSVSPAHTLAGEWQSSSPECVAQEAFHIRISETGNEIVTYDRITSDGVMIGEPWDIGSISRKTELVERTDGSFGGSRIFVPQLSPDKATMSGHWIGHNPLAGCNFFRRVMEGTMTHNR